MQRVSNASMTLPHAVWHSPTWAPGSVGWPAQAAACTICTFKWHSDTQQPDKRTSGCGAGDEAHQQCGEQPDDYHALWPPPHARHLPVHKVPLPPVLALRIMLRCTPAAAAVLAAAAAAAAAAVLAAAAGVRAETGTAGGRCSAGLAAGQHAQPNVCCAMVRSGGRDTLKDGWRVGGGRTTRQCARAGSWCRRHGAAGLWGPRAASVAP